MSEREKSRAFRAFKRVVIVTELDVHARRDTASIKEYEPGEVKVFKTGAMAIDYIADNRVDLILCDSSLVDMTGIKFTQIIKKNMRERPIPVIMITLENEKDHVLGSIAAGCTGYILRPYSMDTFEKYLVLAIQLNVYPEIEEMELQEANAMVERGDFDEAIEAFEELITYQDEAQRYYDMGCTFLVENKFGKAIVAFKKAVKINDLFAEAYKGLAEAYKGKGDIDAYKDNLKKAADIHAQFDRLEETKELFIEILKFEAETPNPFNTLGVKLRKNGDYPGAIHAYDRALALTPEDENIHFNKAKALYFMGQHDDAATSITRALELNPRFAEARKLHEQLHGAPWDGEMPENGDNDDGPTGPSAVDL